MEVLVDCAYRKSGKCADTADAPSDAQMKCGRVFNAPLGSSMVKIWYGEACGFQISEADQSADASDNDPAELFNPVLTPGLASKVDEILDVGDPTYRERSNA